MPLRRNMLESQHRLHDVLCILLLYLKHIETSLDTADQEALRAAIDLLEKEIDLDKRGLI